MKVLTAQPIQFPTGDVLDPEDMNATWNYARDALNDVATKRYQHSAITLQYIASSAALLTQASDIEERTFRFRCEQPCIIDRAFLLANLVSSASVDVEFIDSGGTAAPGTAIPYLTTGAASASASTDVEAFNSDRVQLTAGTEYKIRVVSTGTFTLTRFDVVLHVTTDRWLPASGTLSVPSMAPTLFTDASAPDATVVAANNSAMNTQAALFATGKQAMAPMLFVRSNFTNGTSANVLTFIVPRDDSASAQGLIARIYACAFFDANVTTTVTFTLKDASGSTVTTVTITFTAEAFKSGVSAATTTSLVLAQSDAASDTTKDFTLVMASNSATNCRKAYAYLWLSRA